MGKNAKKDRFWIINQWNEEAIITTKQISVSNLILKRGEGLHRTLDCDSKT